MALVVALLLLGSVGSTSSTSSSTANTSSAGGREPQEITVPAGDLTEFLRLHPLTPHSTLRLEVGDHTLSETLTLGAGATGLTLSGSAGARVTGGYAVPASAWDHTQAIWSAALPAGTWPAGADPPRQLWTGGGEQRRTRARHPDLWNRDCTAVEDSPYLFWSVPLAASPLAQSPVRVISPVWVHF